MGFEITLKPGHNTSAWWSQDSSRCVLMELESTWACGSSAASRAASCRMALSCSRRSLRNHGTTVFRASCAAWALSAIAALLQDLPRPAHCIAAMHHTQLRTVKPRVCCRSEADDRKQQHAWAHIMLKTVAMCCFGQPRTAASPPMQRSQRNACAGARNGLQTIFYGDGGMRTKLGGQLQFGRSGAL